MNTTRNVILQEFVSLDGLVSGENDSVDFIPASMQGDRSFGKEQVELMETPDTLLLGRVTYGMFTGYWPNVTQGDEQAFADKFNALQKVVFSTTLEHAPWGHWEEARIVRGDVVHEVTSLRQQPGKSVLVSGSISIAQLLIEHGLIDEYRLVLCPVVLGTGRRIFRDGLETIAMQLVDAHALDRGAMSLVYRPRRAVS